MRNLRISLVLFIVSVCPVIAQPGDGTIPCPAQAVLPHIAFGGGWSSTIYIGPTWPPVASTVILRFFDSAGMPLMVPLSTTGGATGRLSEITLNVPPEGMVVDLLGTDAATSVGWARSSCTGDVPLQMYEVFRYSAAGRPDYEASVPFSLVRRNSGNPPTVRWVTFPFDNRNGLETGVALVNAGENTAITLTCYAGLTELGSRQSLIARPTLYGAWTLSSLMPAVVGRTGFCIAVGVLGGSSRPAAIALRFTQGGAFSTLPVYSDD